MINENAGYNQIYNNIGQEDVAQAQAFIDTWIWDDAAEKGLAEIQTNEGQRYSLHTVFLINGLEKTLGKGTLLAYIVSLTVRVNEIRRVLKQTGSFYLHCDPTSSHYIKIMLDSVFCSRGGDYLNEITWKRKTGRVETIHRFGICTDIIFLYSKTKNKTYNPQYNNDAPGYQEYVRKFFKHIDENGRLYRIADLSNPAPRPNLMYEYKGYKPPKNGWAVSEEKMRQMEEEGRLHFPKSKDGRIQRRRFLDELKGKPVLNFWDDIEMISSQSAERLGYPTQKPEALLDRIIRASSNEGDTVLDAYCGCGTTASVAHRLNRKWVGIDITYQSISLILKRLEDTFGKEVIARLELSGVPKDLKSARALALKPDDKTRKEFEKWAILTYSNNRAMIKEKKGADKGIDGMAFAMTPSGESQEIIFSVKSGKVQVSHIRDLRGTVEREKAAGGILITLSSPTSQMIQ